MARALDAKNNGSLDVTLGHESFRGTEGLPLLKASNAKATFISKTSFLSKKLKNISSKFYIDFINTLLFKE